MTSATPQGAAPGSDVHVVPLTMSTAEVRVDVGGAAVSIGRVVTTNGSWYWQHRDGEQSSPIAASRLEAAVALAAYHRAFKPQPALPAAAKRLLFG